MVFIKKFWVFLSDFSGVIQTIIYAGVGIGYLKNLLVANKLILFLFLLLLPFVLVSAIKWIIFSYKKFYQKTVNIEIEEEISRLEQIVPPQDIGKLLPGERLLSKLNHSLVKKIKDWASDAEIEALNMFIDTYGNKIKLSLHAYCKSQWRNEAVYIYVGSSNSLYAQEIITNKMISAQDVVPFYKKYPNWRKAIIKAYESIKNKLSSKLQLVAVSHYSDRFHFEFQYYSGIQRSEQFELDGNILKNLKTGKTITI